MYLQQAYRGKTSWWRYIFIFVIFFTVQITVLYTSINLYALIYDIPDGNVAQFMKTMDPLAIGMSLNTGLLFLMLPLALTFWALLFFIKLTHQQTTAQVLTSAKKFRWKHFFFGIAVWGVLLGLTEVVNMQLNPQNYTFNFNASSFFSLLFIAIIMVPFQASAEELYCRGNLMQGFGVLFRYRIFPLLLTSIIFGLMHFGNPEVAKYGLLKSMTYYIGFGLFMGLLVILDGGLEMSMAVHTINNIHGIVFFGYSGSVLKTESLYHVKEYSIDVMIIALVVFATVYILLAKRVFKMQSLRFIFSKIEKQ